MKKVLIISTSIRNGSNSELLAKEMEAFALIHVANSFNREAAVMCTATDSPFTDKIVPVSDRESSLNEMISLALESLI